MLILGPLGVAAAAIGALGAGVSAIGAARRNRQAQDLAKQEQQNQLAQVNAAGQQSAQQQAQFSAQLDQLNQEAERRRQAASALLGTGAKLPRGLTGLDTIKTSPLGDTSLANTGRRKLLGN